MVGADTIAAVATAPGRGAVAIVRISGPAAFAVASRLSCRTVSAADAGRFRRVAVSGADGARIDDALLLAFAAPRSYTGEDVVEIQCHGGAVTPRRVLEACLSAGARIAERGEFTKRAFLSGKLDLDEADAVIDLIDSRTDRAAGRALERLEGRDSRELESLYDTAIELSARAEHALDFDEDALPPDFAATLSADMESLRSRIAAMIATVRQGEMLGSGALAAISGPPNAGKSSLLNALLGRQRSIVSPIAGTTRDSVEETVDIGGWPVRLADTAGLREDSPDAIEREGIARARAIVSDADVAIALVPCGSPAADSCIPAADGRTIRVLSKCDLAPDMSAPGFLRVSAKTGEGLDALRDAIAKRLEALSADRGEASGADAATRRRASLEEALRALDAASPASDLVVAANGLRNAADAIGRMLGRVWTDDLLDSVFSRFCVGK